VFFGPEAFVPVVNEEQIEGTDKLNARGRHWLFQVFGHLKAGVTPAQAMADLNAIGADLEKTYPKDDGQMTFALARPGLYGDYLGPVVQGFLVGLTVLAGLILLAACANLGSLFAARCRSILQAALRLALGRCARVVRLLTEAVLIALAGARRRCHWQHRRPPRAQRGSRSRDFRSCTSWSTLTPPFTA
jgi:hypothetical protein